MPLISAVALLAVGPQSLSSRARDEHLQLTAELGLTATILAGDFREVS